MSNRQQVEILEEILDELNEQTAVLQSILKRVKRIHGPAASLQLILGNPSSQRIPGPAASLKLVLGSSVKQ